MARLRWWTPEGKHRARQASAQVRSAYGRGVSAYGGRRGNAGDTSPRPALHGQPGAPGVMMDPFPSPRGRGMGEPSSFRDLMGRVRRGDEQAATELVRR